MNGYDMVEAQRLQLQSSLDAQKTALERNRLGQFATPTALADDVLQFAHGLLPARQPVRFLDPAIGTGSFYSALLRVFPRSRIAAATGVEIDPHYRNPAEKLWAHEKLQVIAADFTELEPPAYDQDKATLVICNPPYVRHHHLSSDYKARLKQLVLSRTGVALNGLGGLYGYFLCLADAWMAENAIAGWLIPSEFMDVNYGKQLKEYLLNKVTLLHVHRFNPENVQFDDALVSSAVVWLRKAAPPAEHAVTFSYGGSLMQPTEVGEIPVSTLRASAKWTQFPAMMLARNHHSLRLSDLFSIKRGVATGNNNFFVLTQEQAAFHQLPDQFLIPVLPSPRYLKADEVEADECGNPLLPKPLYLLSCNLPPAQVEMEFPTLWQYLQSGVEQGIDQTYLSAHRTPWYAQEKRPPAPFLCTYMGRQTETKQPFRFISNKSRATALNVYLLLYPKPHIAERLKVDATFRNEVWQALQAITPASLKGEGRVYGGGLHKVEPKELSNAPLSLSSV